MKVVQSGCESVSGHWMPDDGQKKEGRGMKTEGRVYNQS